MANEAILVYELEPPVPFTCADGTAITKGAFVKIADPYTVSVTAADGDAIIGVAAEDKIANDGVTKIGVYLRGVFIAVAGTGGVTAGAAVDSDATTSAANKLADAPVNGEHIVGRALETAAATETFLVLVDPFNTNLA